MSVAAPPPGAVALRAVRHVDIAAMWALRTRCVRQVCSTHYPPEVIAAWTASPVPALYPQRIASGGAVLAEDAGGRLRGFGVADLAGSEIDGLFVDPDVRGSGLGRRLLQALEAKLLPGARIHLAAALNAVAFYQAQGDVVLRQGRYAHPGGIALACTYMEKYPGPAYAGAPAAAV
jgi:GNAT superfamily N-acetyltransferase